MCQRWLPIFDKIFKFAFDYFPVCYSVTLPKSLALRLKRLIGLYIACWLKTKCLILHVVIIMTAHGAGTRLFQMFYCLSFLLPAGGRIPRYLVTNLVTNSSPNLVIHQIW